MRKVLIGVGVLVLVIVGAVAWLWSSIDGLVKTAIETVGTKVAGVPVTVGKVSLDIRNGKGSIEGLSIANPKGFATPTAFALTAITVALDPASVAKKPIKIPDVSIIAPQVTYEVTPQGGSNIEAIKKNVDGFVASNAGGKSDAKSDAKSDGSAPAAKPQSAGDDKGAALVIDRLSVTDGKVTLASPVPGVKASAPLPPITMTDIGKDKGGASPADVAQQVLDALSAAAMKSGSGLMLGNVTDVAKGASGAAGDAAKGAADQLKGLLGK
jgi:uncharacterized protein involved in outer membrane biogenesis